ncbi:hypothetical protein CC77DRAFT_1018017 [Alternaria alternata]|uniref:Cylicin I n=2 Tax=Alternaria alternata complex TaxID=187734 RepID=A0A177DUL9_ALTAL|nr:hypothetical protein CC77DRAFT_1018017 [Alternaria alternata]XP_051583163.1 uncharacterized protein J4E82_010868 [Alternaria postmessia]RYN27584.1 hypothetical protein AA0115_g6498 [Alternaria tenuissima]KAI5367027.1 hypothetical protein J4E82_010868 [Alternaria postmessia]OAG23188.1 hypothetical protein CC77DRAFT_1018017 [Alternaria alternata]RYN98065.1 hypothetical protein AA0120_g2372 [Alternaria tenuissima]RYO05674.1 hypothetical protein AA0119_g3404 [Alternaria tenuissima]
MSFIRSSALRASSLARAARPARYIRTAELQPWQRAVQRRTYASGHGPEGDAKSSDVPWMAAAVVGTAVGLYTVVNQDTNHGAEHHPLGDPHGEGGAQKTGTGSTVGEENKQDEPEEETKDESKEESKDESKEEPKSDQQDPSKPTKENSEEKDTQSPDQSDKPDPRKEETKSQNEMSGKQKGLSNDNTEHTSQISKQPEKSKKGEGVAETAKLQGTVSTERPGAENKEERGKAQQDKDA